MQKPVLDAETAMLVQPKQEIVEQLYGMGFPLEVAKKAAIKSKNQSVQHALDVVFEIQESHSAQQPTL